MGKIYKRRLKSEEAEKSINELTNLVDSTLNHVQGAYSRSNSERFQDIVIEKLESAITPDLRERIIYDIGVENLGKSQMISKYYRNVLEGKDAKHFMKVAVMCNSKGGTDVLIEDLEPWLEKLKDSFRVSENKKYLDKPATRSQVLNNLASMIEFPVSVQLTPVSADTELTESTMNGLISNHPEKYLPKGALEYIANGGDIKTRIIVTSHVAEYPNNKNETVQEDVRLKSTAAYKLGKYVLGIRNELHADEVGIKRVVPRFENIDNAVKDILLKSVYGTKPDTRLPQGVSAKDVPLVVEEKIMTLLRSTYFNKSGNVDSSKENDFKNNLIYGTWIDVAFLFKKDQLCEVQIKDRLGDVLYGFDSPHGHNGKAYVKHREDEYRKPIEIGTVSRRVNKIVDYIAKDILLPGYTMF